MTNENEYSMEQIKAFIIREMKLAAICPPRSTSAMHNLVEQANGKAFAKLFEVFCE